MLVYSVVKVLVRVSGEEPSHLSIAEFFLRFSRFGKRYYFDGVSRGQRQEAKGKEKR